MRERKQNNNYKRGLSRGYGVHLNTPVLKPREATVQCEASKMQGRSCHLSPPPHISSLFQNIHGSPWPRNRAH